VAVLVAVLTLVAVAMAVPALLAVASGPAGDPFADALPAGSANSPEAAAATTKPRRTLLLMCMVTSIT
jgi:hypothetical protein